MAINQRSLVCTLILIFSLSTSALANNLPWQGPHIGFYVGGGLGNVKVSTKAGGVTTSSYFETTTDIDAINNAGTWRKEAVMMLAGINTGYDLVVDKIVYGASVDYGWVKLKSSTRKYNNYPSNSDQYSIKTSMSTDWLLTLRGRLGYQHMLKSPSLLYLTGGMALTNLNVRNTFSDNSSLAGTGHNKTHQNQIGWTVGGGIEFLTLRNASLNIEYLFINIPSVKAVGSVYNAQGGFGIPVQSLTSPLSTAASFQANILKIGLNYSIV